MATAQYPLTEFQQSLHGRISANSIHQTAISIRRAIAHIGLDDLGDPQMLAYYRASLPDKTRNVFGCAWNKFVAWSATNGVVLPQTIDMPKTRFVHPLWGDITDLTTVWTAESIERMTWSDERVAAAEPEVRAAAHRAFCFLAGRQPTGNDWLLPRRIDSQDPLPAWAITGILRSDERATNRGVESFWRFIVEVSTRRDITAHELKQAYALLWDHRIPLAKDFDRVKVTRREIEEDAGLPWNVSHHRLSALAGAEFGPVGDLIFW